MDDTKTIRIVAGRITAVAGDQKRNVRTPAYKYASGTAGHHKMTVDHIVTIFTGKANGLKNRAGT